MNKENDSREPTGKGSLENDAFNGASKRRFRTKGHIRSWRGAKPLIVLFIYWVALVGSTHYPLEDRVLPGWIPDDSAIHFGMYAVFAILIILVVLRPNRLKLGFLVLTLSILSIHAALDEATQSFIPGRTADPWDWLADVCGVTLVFAIFWGYDTAKQRNDKGH